ncbi:unnamed protein product [Protopolystoma xenopodis]|uniref:Uncharacterized protein n=1 Tax=Protopolystoma xenopodis TaxID=117903 RepID=A0A3S5B845_9PLAT|nr:unnamed protein product [Protopolystoma xenopodis]
MCNCTRRLAAETEPVHIGRSSSSRVAQHVGATSQAPSAPESEGSACKVNMSSVAREAGFAVTVARATTACAGRCRPRACGPRRGLSKSPSRGLSPNPNKQPSGPVCLLACPSVILSVCTHANQLPPDAVDQSHPASLYRVGIGLGPTDILSAGTTPATDRSSAGWQPAEDRRDSRPGLKIDYTHNPQPPTGPESSSLKRNIFPKGTIGPKACSPDIQSVYPTGWRSSTVQHPLARSTGQVWRARGWGTMLSVESRPPSFDFHVARRDHQLTQSIQRQ